VSEVRLAKPRMVRGRVVVPGDKSISHRALVLAALAEGRSRIAHRATGDDQASMIRCLEALGVTVSAEADSATVDGVGLRGLRSPAADLDCGNSGATMRFLAGAVAGVAGVRARLSGDASLSRRPMERVAAPLRRLGAEVSCAPGGTPPLEVAGRPLTGAAIDLDVPSAQVKTAVLLAALNASGATSVREPAPTRDHTERMLRRLGVELTQRDGNLELRPPASLPAFAISVPGDPSSAAFWAVLAAAHEDAEVEIPGVCLNPTRTGALEVLRRMGARVEVLNRRDEAGEEVGDLVVRSAALHGTEVTAAEVPALVDEVPVLAVAAAAADGETVMRGLGELRVKESDRLTAIAAALGLMGVAAEVDGDDLRIRGGGLRGAALDSAGDHRLAMALAVAGELASGGTTIRGAGAAAVSYPAFFDELSRLSVQ